jgi:mannose-6-phosphate isomerase-like protein (cupin superfamily)
MAAMSTEPLPSLDVNDAAIVVAPDGSTVRILLAGSGASMARFELDPGRTSIAVRHRTVEELWYVLCGQGEIWRRRGAVETIVALHAGVCLLIPVGTSFQFRADGGEPLLVVGATVPAWPGPDEAELVEGCRDWTQPA